MMFRSCGVTRLLGFQTGVQTFRPDNMQYVTSVGRQGVLKGKLVLGEGFLSSWTIQAVVGYAPARVRQDEIRAEIKDWEGFELAAWLARFMVGSARNFSKPAQIKGVPSHPDHICLSAEWVIDKGGCLTREWQSARE